MKKQTKRIDCLGDMCPMPVMKLQAYLENIEKGETIDLVTDHSCAVSTIETFCRQKNLSYDVVEPMMGIWEISIKKKANRLP